MKKQEIQNFLKPLNKNDLKKVIQYAEEQLNSSLGIGDSVTLTIEYMIGDADGNTEKSIDLDIESEDELNALYIIQNILDNHTEPNKGCWGFSLDERSFSEKPQDVYNILYNQKKAPKTYNGISITPKVLETISIIEEECFRSETEYSFLTYEGHIINQ